MKSHQEYQKVIGDNVRRLREQFAPADKRTYKEFAEWVGIGKGTIERLEKYEEVPTDPQLSTLVTIAEKFKLEAWHLLFEDVAPENKPHVLTPHEKELHLKFEELMKEKEKMAALPASISPPPNKRAAKKFRRNNK